MKRASILACFVLVTSACSTMKSEMRQAETAYNQANYEDAIRWFEALESDEPRMKTDERAKYHYLRGMASYRLGRRDDALYYLSIAREIATHEGAQLEDGMVAEMNSVIEELTPTDAGFHAREEGAGGEDAVDGSAAREDEGTGEEAADEPAAPEAEGSVQGGDAAGDEAP